MTHIPANPALTAAAVEEMCRIWVDDLSAYVEVMCAPSAALALTQLSSAIDACFATVSALREEGPDVLLVAEACQDLQRCALAMMRRA